MKLWLTVGALLFCVSCDSSVAESVGDGGVDGHGDGHVESDMNCEYPQQTPRDARNDLRCPTQYGGPLFSLCASVSSPCSAPGITCRYHGVGDGRPGCYAIAMMWCNPPSGSDGGAGSVWTCAN
jgi:hypothetical protein